MVQGSSRAAVVLAKRHPIAERMPFPPDDETRQRFLFGFEWRGPRPGDAAEDSRQLPRSDGDAAPRAASCLPTSSPGGRAAAADVEFPDDVPAHACRSSAPARKEPSVFIGPSSGRHPRAGPVRGHGGAGRRPEDGDDCGCRRGWCTRCSPSHRPALTRRRGRGRCRRRPAARAAPLSEVFDFGSEPFADVIRPAAPPRRIDQPAAALHDDDLVIDTSTSAARRGGARSPPGSPRPRRPPLPAQAAGRAGGGASPSGRSRCRPGRGACPPSGSGPGVPGEAGGSTGGVG